MLMPQGVLARVEQSSWGVVGLMWEELVPFSLWSHLVRGRLGPFLVRPSGARVPHLQPHAQALSDSILCEVQLSSHFEVPSPALTDVQYHFAAVIRVSLIFITMHWTSVSDSVCVCVFVCVFSTWSSGRSHDGGSSLQSQCLVEHHSQTRQNSKWMLKFITNVP